MVAVNSALRLKEKNSPKVPRTRKITGPRLVELSSGVLLIVRQSQWPESLEENPVASIWDQTEGATWAQDYKISLHLKKIHFVI